MELPDGAMDTLLLDLRLGWRSLRRNTAFSAAALLTLALGIGGTCAIFGVLNAVFLRPLPFEEEARLVRLRDFTAAPGGAISPVNITGRHFLEILAQSRTLSGISAQTGRNATLTGGQTPERVDAVVLSPGSMAVLGVRPAMGRAFLPDEEEKGIDAGVALISTALWRSRLGADPGVLGRTLQIDGRTVRIVGVLPPGYRFPYHADIWLPARIDPVSPDDYAVFARIAPGHTLSEVRAELRAVASRMRERDPRTYPGYGILAAPLRESLIGDQDRVALALLVVLGFFLLLACVDVAALLFARSVSRQHEFALRSALGASRGRQIRQLLTESALLAIIGGAGLVIENFRLLRGRDLGFDERQLLTAEIELPRSRYSDGARRATTVAQLSARLASTPGVTAAGVVTMNPLRGGTWSAPVIREGHEEKQAASIYHRLVTPGLLGAMRIPLLRGRDVEAADGPDVPPVAVISARLAARLWPDEDAIGKRLRIAREGSPWRTVIGVVRDVHERFDVHEAWYLPYAQNAATPAAEILEVMVRSPMDPGSLGAAVRDAVASVDPELAIAQMATMERVHAETLTQERVAAQTVSLFAMLGLALAALGTYGVISYAMARRTRELAIRAAIGAAPGALIQLVMGHGLGLAAGGVVAGLGLAVAFHRVVASQLSQVAAADPR